jgi:hypothetical protein
MKHDPIFVSWRPRDAAVWGNAPMKLRHRLHEHPLFADEALADLVEGYPRHLYNLVQWGSAGETGLWREGELGPLSGSEIIRTITEGRVWINMRELHAVDPRYGTLVEEIFEELEEYMPQMRTFTRRMGLLISSPLSRTLYHLDLPGQSLWQIRGRKRVYVYPAASPFLTPEMTERVTLSGVEVNIPYTEWFDEHAIVLDIEPGDMLHWPLHSPHRVDNANCLNVSMTLEYFTEDIRRAQIVARANAILRTKFGVSPSSASVSGPTFWAKAALQRALRDTHWIRSEDKARRKPEFRLDPTRPGGVAEIGAV